jgi:ribosomal protein S18 acetylase RimI-like enzyme
MDIEEKHDFSTEDVAAIERRLYEHICQAIGSDDAKDLGYVARDEHGNIIGAALGCSWSGISELKQLWVAESCRGRGLGSTLLDNFINEARKRGARRVWLATYDFQAPDLYERAGFMRVISLKDWPIGHANSIFCLDLDAEHDHLR